MADDADITTLPNYEFHIHVRQKGKQCLPGRTYGPCDRMLSRCTVAEIKGLFTLSWPTVSSYFFYHLVFMITLCFAGHLGEVELAAGTLAISFINLFGPSIFHGLCSALEALSSQADGAKNFRMVGVVLYCREACGFLE